MREGLEKGRFEWQGRQESRRAGQADADKTAQTTGTDVGRRTGGTT